MATTSANTATQDQVDNLVLELLPLQGQWSEELYLWLTDQTNRLVEFTDGYIEVLPMPTDRHQSILLFL
ncbi:MAG: Uma2 family endonuclease, partial [Chloroflexota bacterium]|nr:Uma2 family endonuclease [Chloroflexota bacterium]